MLRVISCVCLLAAFSPVLCAAQNAQDPATSPANQHPSPGPKDVATSAPPTDKSKKVWTNEDLKSSGSVSVIGDPKNQKYPMTKPPDPATVAKYRNMAQKLQSQLDDVNNQLKAYQDFSEGKSVSEGGRDFSRGYSRTPINQQIAKLQDKKKQLEAQLDAVYEESRKKGIESGLLK